MFAMAARRMGYRVHTFSPEMDTPTGQVADVEIIGQYDDLDAVRSFAGAVDSQRATMSKGMYSVSAGRREVSAGSTLERAAAAVNDVVLQGFEPDPQR